MTANSFGSRATLRAGETDYTIFRLDAVKGAEIGRASCRERVSYHV